MWTPPSFFSSRKSSTEVKKFPPAYQTNTDKEKYMLECCENFKRQYKHLYRDRKPLFLSPKNECDVEVSFWLSFITTSGIRDNQIVFDIWPTDTFYGPERIVKFFINNSPKLRYLISKLLKMSLYTVLMLNFYYFQAKVKNLKTKYLSFEE